MALQYLQNELCIGSYNSRNCFCLFSSTGKVVWLMLCCMRQVKSYIKNEISVFSGCSLLLFWVFRGIIFLTAEYLRGKGRGPQRCWIIFKYFYILHPYGYRLFLMWISIKLIRYILYWIFYHLVAYGLSITPPSSDFRLLTSGFQMLNYLNYNIKPITIPSALSPCP